MKKMFAKMRKVRMSRWNKLSAGEKVLKVVMKLVKWALVAALVVAVAGVAVVAAVGLFVGFAIMNAVSGGFYNASRAYRSGDVYVRFR